MSELVREHQVFAYGSNMHTTDLRRWFSSAGYPPPQLGTPKPGVLHGYRLAWNYHSQARKGGAANIEAAPAASVAGVVFSVDAQTLDGFDAKEGHPHRYRRATEPLAIQLLDGQELAAWVYQVTPPFRRPEPVWPRQAYLALLISAAEELGLPSSHVAQLKATPTQDEPG